MDSLLLHRVFNQMGVSIIKIEIIRKILELYSRIEKSNPRYYTCNIEEKIKLEKQNLKDLEDKYPEEFV